MPRRLAPIALALLLAACGEGEPLLPPNAVLPDGGRYRGEIVDGLLQGEGRLDYPDGSWYAGHFKDGQLEGRGELHLVDGHVYRGDFHLGQMHGQGVLTGSDGSRYEGGFKQGRMDGEGYLKRDGMTYRGGFRNDLYHGQGVLESGDGNRFQGQFANGSPSGAGVRVADGEQLSGTFDTHGLNGQGSYQSDDGAIYSGGFHNSVFSGKGRYQSAEGDVWVGQFVDGAMKGQGEFIGADGERYKGAFRNWRYSGEGTLNRADGSVYQGAFVAGQYAGRGILTDADGKRQGGTWKNGLRIRDESGKSLPDPLEIGLLTQGHLLDQAIAALPASTPAVELYSLTLAGDGNQSVFLREADYVAKLLQERFGAYGNITLANHREHIADRPMATRETLARAVRALAERSGKEDLLFIYLTSHGSHDHQLSLDQPRMNLDSLAANDLATLLEPIRDRYKVVVISACYSGGFIPALKDDKTLVMTAARPDRVSFGCSEENDFTYFGRALFADALNQTDDLQRAFELARQHVAEWEKEDDFEPSEPQIWAPQGVIERWKALRARQASQALNARYGE
ncbi:C13 family peptidase [Pseudomonas sp. LRF_L74]|uniref:C13 family peptidase n=1 Tax=Pseudomonas sp. LRF_L74 TaxID=3369422 RepID=UPI003F626E56